MCRRTLYVLLVLAFGLAPVAQGAKIIWVSDNVKYDFDANEPADAGFVNLLRAQGHEVDYKGEVWPYDPNDDDIALNPDWQYWWELDPNKVDELNAADLVIISRIASSGKYDDVDADTGFSEPNEWNAVMTPMISLNAHISRNSKWKWVNGNETYSKEVLADVVAPDHAVFDGVAIDPNSQALLLTDEYNVNVIGATDAGNGTLLAARASDGSVAIAAWEAGVEFYEGSGQIAGGPRMFLAAGSGSKSPKDGLFNLTADGEQAFLNAVNYMLNKNKQIIWVSFHGADDAPAQQAIDEGGFTEASDIGYTDLLTAAGYNVQRYITNNDPNAAILNAADLVIISRTVSSSHYSNDAATKWNGISAPMMILDGYVLRSSRMGFTDGTSMPDTTGDIKLTVLDPDHPIFAGVALTDGTMDNPFAEGAVPLPTDPTIISRGISINNNTPNADGTVLAVIAEASADTGPVGGMVIGEWPANAVLTHAGGAEADMLAGPRLVFLTGSREPDGVTGGEAAGLYDLYQDGTQMFLSAVAYMLTERPIVENGSFELPGTDKFKAWDGEKDGEGGEPATDIPGWSSDSTPVDSGVETNWGATDGEWSAFLKGADPSVWQLTDFIMGADDVIELKVDAKDNWQATVLQLSMYIDVGGVRVSMATAEFALTDTIQEFTLTFAVSDQPLAAGMRLGVEIANVSAEGESWAGFDNVRVEILE